jgi:hypothetical protein
MHTMRGTPTRILPAVAAFALVFVAAPADASTVRGGGSKKTDCMSTFEAPGANKPPIPKIPKHVDCIDGDPACDVDGLRNAVCVFDLQVCLNSTIVPELADCGPVSTESLRVDHSDDDGDPKFDPDFQALQARVDTLGLPNADPDACTLQSAITVPLRIPKSGSKYRTNKKKVKLTALGAVAADPDTKDKDKIRFKCRAEGDAIYLPTDLYTGTFDRIREQVFAPGCAVSFCHDSESSTGNLILLPGAAYSQIVNVLPDNIAAEGAGLLRVAPGDEVLSFLYRKITNDLEAGWGSAMPLGQPGLSSQQLELIRLWILGDGTLGPAPETGWVVGTTD